MYLFMTVVDLIGYVIVFVVLKGMLNCNTKQISSWRRRTGLKYTSHFLHNNKFTSYYYRIKSRTLNTDQHMQYDKLGCQFHYFDIPNNNIPLFMAFVTT